MEPVWFKDPSVLFHSDKILKFWPTQDQSVPERVNATTRFILYASSIIYLVKRDSRIFILAVMGLAVLYILWVGGVISGSERPTRVSQGHTNCHRPTESNPMGNVLMTDYVDRPDRPSACYYPTVKNEVQRFLDDTIQYDAGRSRSPLPEYQRNASARQFTSMPVTQIPGDQTSFAEFLYGSRNRPLCRDDPTQCDPDMRGVQLEAFSGLDPNGDKRSGMIPS